MFEEKPTDEKIQQRFWSELESSRFVMLGLTDARDGHTQPMTAVFDEGQGPLWFYTTKDNGLVEALRDSSQRAIATYTAKGHDLFASIHGTLAVETDRTTVDRFWNAHVAAWYEGGKDDPRLAMLRLDTEKAEIWLGGSSIGAALTYLLGRDPKETYKDNVAEVRL